MSGEHAPIAPSSLALTVACPGWRQQAAGLPEEPEGEAAREGNAGHWVALAARTMPIEQYMKLAGTLAPNGVEIDEDMLDGGLLWADALEGFPARLEERISIQRIHMRDCWGTPDAFQWAEETATLRVADYKYGHGYVSEFENWQLIAYAIGVIDLLKLYERGDATIEFMIVQPRYYHAPPVRSWKLPLESIWSYLETAQRAVRVAELPDAETRSGPHCQHCPARVNCQTFQQTVTSIVDFVGRADPVTLDGGSVGRELKLVTMMLARLEARKTGLEARAEQMIRSGQPVPYFTLKQSVGRLAWTVPAEVVEITAQMRGKSVMKPPQMITPTQARDRKILDAKVIDAYSERPPGALKLVADPTNTTRLFKP